MKPQVSAVTLGVRDLARSRRFYVDGLGWQPLAEQTGEIFFIQIAPGQILALWDVASMRGEYGDVGHCTDGPAAPLSLGRNANSPQEVDRLIAEAVDAGAELVSAGRNQSWGGYSGCFADPDGFRWDIVFNPAFSVDDGGNVSLGMP
ncbi:glyoxalase/bleomycin resistance protein/dioxygenase [Arthrobacter crystallopoietes BAB-32]|uniref:Glyoxalase/bleomycin resistance protein/dioxygenase n=1 Tax=Arthrobacter crystallopoietes BAB-32 TaxID=1246476 RepID=N1UYA7_9MICC|nr:VOC family protein [Arthrobacter crystallopoietes]EMY34050.1 glyoxalase/bleomycin resistance protein/dioxygenase [Arthrobacter crystallopoietes BAB-32]